MTADADAPVGNTSGRHGASTLPFATCQVRPLDQLKYLAKVMGFEIQVTNIPTVCLSAIHGSFAVFVCKRLAFLDSLPSVFVNYFSRIFRIISLVFPLLGTGVAEPA